jgi:hypothetical protein
LGELELEVQVNRALRLLLLGFMHDAMVATGSSTGNDASPPEPDQPGFEDGGGSKYHCPRRGGVAIRVRSVHGGVVGAGRAGEPRHE